MNVYETLFVLQPAVSDEQIDEIVKGLEAIIPEKKGNVLKSERWGKRKLAYRIAGHSDGVYIRFEFEGDGEIQRELERRMKINDNVIRHLTTRVDPRLTIQVERKAEREGNARNHGGNSGGSPKVVVAPRPETPENSSASTEVTS